MKQSAFRIFLLIGLFALLLTRMKEPSIQDLRATKSLFTAIGPSISANGDIPVLLMSYLTSTSPVQNCTFSTYKYELSSTRISKILSSICDGDEKYESCAGMDGICSQLDDPINIYLCGMEKLRFCNTSEAVKVWSEAQTIDIYFAHLSENLFRAGDSNNALMLSDLSSAINSRIDHAKAGMYRELCKHYLNDGEYWQALKWCRMFTRTSPSISSLVLNGRVHMELNQPLEAYDLFSRALSFDVASCYAGLWSGIALKEIGLVEKAKEQLGETINLSSCPWAHIALAQIAREEGEYDEALTHLKIATNSRDESASERAEELILDLKKISP